MPGDRPVGEPRAILEREQVPLALPERGEEAAETLEIRAREQLLFRCRSPGDLECFFERRMRALPAVMIRGHVACDHEQPCREGSEVAPVAAARPPCLLERFR